MTPPVGGSARGLRRPRRLLNSQAYQTLIDDYERSSLDYYTEVSESWSIGNSTVGHGANSVQQDTTGSPGVLLSTPGSGLPHYPTRGDIVSGLVYTEGTPGVILNGKDGNNFYAAVVDDANNDLVFWERNGGTYTKIYEKNISSTISDTTWYEAEVEWAPGDNFDLTVYNWDTSTESRGSKVAFATHNFTPFTDGSGNLANGFGWFNVVNSPTIDADYARLQTQVEIAFLVNSESDIRTTGGSRWYGRPVMAEKSNGDWIACYRDASDHGTYDDSEIHIIFSTDSGASWTADDTYTDGSSVSGFPYSISGESVSIGYPFVAPNDDILVHVSTQGTGGAITGTHQLRSTDGGATWTDEGQVSISGTTNDDQYYAQDHAYNPDTGELVTIFYRDGDGLRWATSTDNGSSWTDEGLIRDTSSTESGLEVGIEYIGNDTYVCLNRGNNGETFLIRSTDGGSTWSSATDISDDIGSIQKPHLTNDGAMDYWYGGTAYTTGALYVSGRSGDINNRSRVNPSISKSTDGGQSWTRPVRGDPGSDAGYASTLRRDSNTLYQLSYRGPGYDSASIVDVVYDEQ